MATYYSIGSGNWTWTSANTANWSLSSGGASAGVAPTSSDNVIFDSNSTTGIVTWTTGVCLSLSCIAGTGNFAGTLGNNATTHTIPGSFELAPNPGMTYNGTAALTFTATTSGWVVRTGANTMPSLTFSGVGGVWTLQDNVNMGTTTLALNNGDLECNGKTITCGVLGTSNSNVRTINLDNCTLNLGSTGTVLSMNTTTNLTLSTTNCQVNITNTSASTKAIQIGAGPSITLGGVNVTGGVGSGLVNFSSAGGNSMGAITNTPGNPVTIGITANQTATSLNIQGSASNQSSIKSGTAGTRRSIGITNASTATYTTFQDINASVANINATTGGYSGGNNNNITFPNPYLIQTITSDTASSGTTLTAQFANNTAANSLLVLGITVTTGTVTSITDAQGNTHWTLATSIVNGTATTYLYYCWAITGGTRNTVTANLSSTLLVASMIYREYGGIITTNPLDQIGSATGITGNISATTGVTSQAKELVVGFGTSFTNTDTLSVGAGYTNFIADANQLTDQTAMEELITSATGAQTATFVNSVVSTWSGLIGTFQVPAATKQLAALGVG